MSFFRLTFAGLVVGQLLSMDNPNWLVPSIGVTALLHDAVIPPQAQVIDQRAFSVLHNVPPPSQMDGFSVRIRYTMLLRPS
jgi:hypothetical protein